MGGDRHRRRYLGALAAGVLSTGVLAACGGTGSTAPEPAPKPQPKPRAQHAPATRESKPRRTRSALERLIKLGYPLFCGGHKGRYVALTFDDGPGPYTTEYAFKIFRQARVRVTWFLVGRLLAGYPGVPKRELAFGPLGDHTWSHAYLPGLSTAAMATEIASAQNAIEKASGRPVKLFRPPYGAHNATVDAETRSLGMLQVLWSIDSRDSQGADWRGITKIVLDTVKPGSIILFHENRGQTIRALKFDILPALRRRGLKPVTIPELLRLDPPSLAQLRKGHAAC